MPDRTRPAPRLAVLGAVAAIALAACSSSGGAASAPAPTAAPSASIAESMAPESMAAESPSAPAASSTAPASAAGGEVYTLAVATDATVGKYLTGEDGKTLYTFTPDSENKSACSGGCATAWPPLAVESDDQVKAGDGVTGKIDTFKRDDGSMQVSYNGKPLYYFASDTKAGDVTGQGVGGKWFVAAP